MYKVFENYTIAEVLSTASKVVGGHEAASNLTSTALVFESSNILCVTV